MYVCDYNNHAIRKIVPESSVSLAGVSEPGLEIQVYPNPVLNCLQVYFRSPDQEPARVELAEASGRVVRQFTVRQGEKNLIPMEDLGEGIYLLNFYCHQGMRKTLKLVK